jgi:CcmD family protein
MIPYAVSIKYMIAGYAVIFLVLTAYLVSLIVRWQRLKRDLQTLEDLERLNYKK